MLKIPPVFDNYFLNSLKRVEVNLGLWRRRHHFAPVSVQSTETQNPWLHCGERVERALGQGLISDRLEWQQTQARPGLLPKPWWGRPGRFQRLSKNGGQQTDNRQAVYQEYQRLADHIIPTLARINRRVEARRAAVGLQPAPLKRVCTADESLVIALRAALKQRG